MLTLYYKPTCPYCQKVFEAADTLGIEFDLRDISDDEQFAEELVTLGGKRQVPYLVDTERATAMYESDDIIAYLRERGGQTATPNKPRIHVAAGAVCESCEG